VIIGDRFRELREGKNFGHRQMRARLRMLDGGAMKHKLETTAVVAAALQLCLV